MKPALIHADEYGEVWHGDSLDPEHITKILGDRTADAIVVDAPFSKRTHKGHAAGKLTADRAASFAHVTETPEARYSGRKAAKGESGRRDLAYPHWTPSSVETFCDLWIPRCRGWVVSLTDHVLARDWEGAYDTNGLCTFPPIPFIETGSRVRMTGDGPSNWTCWTIVGRPRTARFSRWGTLPGSYVQPAERDINSRLGTDRIVGGKPERSMRAIVRDYSRPRGLVIDPTCGAGTTLLAAKSEGRLYIGIDKVRAAAELSAKRVAARPFVPALFTSERPRKGRQTEMFR